MYFYTINRLLVIGRNELRLTDSQFCNPLPSLMEKRCHVLNLLLLFFLKYNRKHAGSDNSQGI